MCTTGLEVNVSVASRTQKIRVCGVRLGPGLACKDQRTQPCWKWLVGEPRETISATCVLRDGDGRRAGESLSKVDLPSPA
jgi:hypothetical protein